MKNRGLLMIAVIGVLFATRMSEGLAAQGSVVSGSGTSRQRGGTVVQGSGSSTGILLMNSSESANQSDKNRVQQIQNSLAPVEPRRAERQPVTNLDTAGSRRGNNIGLGN